jgi:hypothetical protein
MSPGIYYLQGGGFQMSDSSSVTGAGVMFYNGADSGGKTGEINMNSSASVSLTPPSSGTYQGVILFQDRTSNQKVHLTSNDSWNMTGTIYAAASQIQLSAKGGTVASQYICDQLEMTAESTLRDIDPSKAHGPKSVYLVE